MINERFILQSNLAYLPEPEFGFNGFGEAVFYRTYSRIKSNGTQENWRDVVIRVVNGVMSIRKDWNIKNRLGWDEVEQQLFAQQLAEHIYAMRMLPPGRGLWAMGTEYVYERGSAALNNCFAYETKIITNHGIREIGGLVGQKVTLLTDGGKWVTVPIQNFGKQKLLKLTLSKAGSIKTIYVTADHRWFAIDRRNAHRGKGYVEFKTSDLRPGIHHLQSIYGQGIKSAKPSPFGIAHGVTFGDGTTVLGERNANSLVLCGGKAVELYPYFSLCPTSCELVVGEIDKIRVGALPNFFKSIPSLEENKSYLLGWLMGYFATDGSCNEKGSSVLSSAKKEHLEFVQDVCSLLGIGAYNIRKENRISNLTHKPHTMYSLTLESRTLDESFFLLSTHKRNFIKADSTKVQHWTVKSVEESDREEDVYCAMVPETHSFALEGNILTGNCGAVDSTNLEDAVDWAMDMLMCGVGVGFNTAWDGKINATNPEIILYVIEDSRGGWVASVRALIEAYTKGKPTPIFDYSKIRAVGLPIKGFGGTASGPAPLIALHKRIKKVLNDYSAGVYNKTRTVADIFNAVGACVVAGNVRRSAEIALGDVGDETFLGLKQDPSRADIAWMSNNSVVLKTADDFHVLPQLANEIVKNGEPGLLNLINIQKFGRVGKEGIGRECEADKAWLSNPCGEIPLESKCLCNLVEVFPTRCGDNLQEVLKFATFYASTVSLLPTHREETNRVIARNRRIGVSLSGIADWLSTTSVTEMTRILRESYKTVRDVNAHYAALAGVPESIRVTTIKPSGTVSLLAGVSPGIHFPTFKYAIRRMRVGNDTPICKVLKNAGVPSEPDLSSANTTVFEFPIEQSAAREATSVSAWEQFALLAMLQREWSDNMVSCTVYFNKDEGGQVEHMLAQFAPLIKSVSMLPHSEKGAYKQMPYEGITKEEYLRLLSLMPKINWSKFNDSDGAQERFCSNDTCEI